ncbi:MAG: hypothetical protein BWZ02_00067 [Lentisphaerae bacterium ADurb.BinA184]|nr:MAG: hypothetical protein BWZ02_00067 [Lentisphaerae bacterium ADurb.BinA184]
MAKIKAQTVLRALALAGLAVAAAARADEKVVIAAGYPTSLGLFEVAPDGGTLYFGAGDFVWLDRDAAVVKRVGTPQGSSARELMPLGTGEFIACASYNGGHIARWRADGTPIRKLVGKGKDEKQIRSDMTGWTSPCGAAIDEARQRIFVLDTTMAPRDDRKIPDPDWSRIAVYDFDGNYLADINRYDAAAPDAAQNDARRTWYDDIEADAGRQRVYVTARASAELLAFGYDGARQGAAPGRGGIAVFPDGRVAVGGKSGGVQIYSPELSPLTLVELPPGSGRLIDLECDNQGGLYASFENATLAFVHWSADLATREEEGPPYRRLTVDWGERSRPDDAPFVIKATLSGRPTPEPGAGFTAWYRPVDGPDVNWRPLPSTPVEGGIEVTPPAAVPRACELAVRAGEGLIDLGDLRRDPSLTALFVFRPAGAESSLSVFSTTGRRVFRAGEAIDIEVVARGPLAGQAGPLRIVLGNLDLGQVSLQGGRASLRIPPTLTARLTPGTWGVMARPPTPQAGPAAAGWVEYPLHLEITAAEADSPLQRVVYQEFEQAPATVRPHTPQGLADIRSGIRLHAAALARQGFNRETDRLATKIDRGNGPAGWGRGYSPVPLAHPGFAPPEHYALPHPGANWEAEFYLDCALRNGIGYDTQILAHCDGVKFRDVHLEQFNPTLQRIAQWLGRYPAFRGFNYNDEMFFGGWAQGWTPDDAAWLDQAQAGPLAGRPRADVLMHALRVMYGNFNAAAREALPGVRLTTTPMWQFPAVEGSYAPVIYEGMDESYTHFLSEGYNYTWYPAHSVELLRRPGLPVMGVFDNHYGYRDGAGYLQDLMQVLGRGVQGAGTQHKGAFADPAGATAYAVGNELARLYGPVFAEAAPDNEAAVLYSYTQDITEKRNQVGTPHFERVFELTSAGLMAGVPMSIVYEEDVSAGWLLPDGAPRVPMLFLVGQTQPLPDPVWRRIEEYAAAGGRVFGDAACAERAGVTKLAIETHRLRQLYHDGYAADTMYPLCGPVLEQLATELRAAVAACRRWPVDSDSPWVAVNRFAGGDVRYILLSTDEGAPPPWEAGDFWALGSLYRFSVLPQRARLSLPRVRGVVYDLFERRQVQLRRDGERSVLDADMTLFPGRLFAVAPFALEAPRLEAMSRPDGCEFTVSLRGSWGRELRGRVPILIRLFGRAGASDDAVTMAAEISRLTDAQGQFRGTLAVPAGGQSWRLQVTEMLGGRQSEVTVQGWPGAVTVVVRPDVDVLRPDRIAHLLEQNAGRPVQVVATETKHLEGNDIDALLTAFQARGVDVEVADSADPAAQPGVLVLAGVVRGQAYGPVLARAVAQGLLPVAVSDNVPGDGRGVVTAVFAPRQYRENAIVILGGDAAGLRKAVRELARYLTTGDTGEATVGQTASAPAGARGRRIEASLPPPAPLRERIGIRLDGVQASGKRILLTAKGLHRNLALIDVSGPRPEVVLAARVGQGESAKAWLSPDGRRFGASARVAGGPGLVFAYWEDAASPPWYFAPFGDAPRTLAAFAVSSDGRHVVVPGRYGAACFERTAEGWREAWARESWPRFASLDWPVSAMANRDPFTDVAVPPNADYAVLAHSELTNNGWVTPEYTGGVTLEAVGLADGRTRWSFPVPIPDQLLFFQGIEFGADLALVQVQAGSWNKETYHFFTLDAQGRELGHWEGAAAPTARAVSPRGDRVALSYDDRRVEVRGRAGELLASVRMAGQPVSLVCREAAADVLVGTDSGEILCVGRDGQVRPLTGVAPVARLAMDPLSWDVVAAGWDGRLRILPGGEVDRALTFDCTPAMQDATPLREVQANAAVTDGPRLIRPRRSPTCSSAVPAGDNLLRNGGAKLTVGGTGGWMSEGKVQITAEDLTDGKVADSAALRPWLSLDELFWSSTAGREMWVQVDFPQPTDVRALTVYDEPSRPAAWTREAVVQIWHEEGKQWKAAAVGVFLDSAVNTYALDAKGVTRLRYLPRANTFTNLYCTEVEVR